FDFSEQWFLFFPNLIKYKEKEILSVKMVSQHQSKDSGSKKNEGKELGMVAPQDKSSKKMKFASSSAETEPTSQTTISDDSKTGRGMSTMPRVVKRKLQKLRPIVEYNKRGKGIGQAHSEMQSYIGVLARSRVPLVDKKWSQIPKDIKEQIWEAADMAFVVGQGGKNSVLSSAAKKWKDFKSTLTRHYILPYTNDKEKLSQPPETYKFIEKAQWDAFVASRLSKDFESVHSQHAQIREKLEYNHRLSRKGYAGLEDQLEETMPGVEIDRSTLWKRARQDKHGNIPDPKVAEKAKLIDELQKQVSEGKVSVYGSNDVLTMALGPEHPGRVRGVGSGISPRQYFNLPKPQRVSFDDRLKDSLRVLLQEETKKMEAKAREEALRMEARTKQLVEAEREHFLSQLSQLIPNFDPSMLKPRISQSPKNPMSDKASCSGGDVRSLHFEDDTAKNGKHQEDEEKEEEKKDEEKEEEKQEEKEKEDEEKHDDKVIEVGDYSNMEAPSSLKTLCRYVETTLMPEEKILQFTIDKEVFGRERDTFLLPEDITQFAGMEEIGATVVAVYMRYLHDVLKQANMCSMVGFIDPATVSANSGTIADRSRLVAARLQKTDGEQIFMMPYNPGRHWVLLIVRAKRETVYFLDPLPGHRVVDEEAKNIVNSAIKIYNSHIGRAGRTPKQPSNVECGYYVMRFMRDIIMDPSLAFENK
ncbi:PREDICTED: PRUPE_6G193600, partial [Prunus dulcis]